MRPRRPIKDKEFAEKVIKINRITRVVKGGRRLRFRAIVAVGDRRGRIGFGIAKANEVSDAVSKAVAAAKNNLVTVTIHKETIPHEISGKFQATTIFIKPAPVGTGIIAGGAVRDILEISGINNIVAKTFGSRNKVNSTQATFIALQNLRSQEEIYRARGKQIPHSKEENKSSPANPQPKATPAKPQVTAKKTTKKSIKKKTDSK